MTKNHLYEYENKYIKRGYQYICGTDEAGRGPLAGPVVAAAVIFPEYIYLPEVNDSKKLSKKKRQLLVEVIKTHALAIGIAMVDEKVIDEINIYQASKKAMLEAIAKLEIKPDFILTDAMPLGNDIEHESIIKGDAKSVSIAAASIIAKTYRDDYMAKLHVMYPLYDFIHNQGYGTKKHIEALKLYGITPHHRLTYEPVKTLWLK